MADEKKATYITSSEHTLLPSGTATSESVSPGGRVAFDENNDSHKFLRDRIESGDPDYAHLQILEVDHKAEAKADEEREEQLAKAAKIAAEAREEQAQAAIEAQEEREELQAKAQEEGQPSATAGTNFPAQDEEAQSLAVQSGAGQRASTQEDVADEDKPNRRSRKK